MAPDVERENARVGRTRIRVRYPETDRMGVAHHTHFLVWFELGRTELMRELGCPYSEVEDRDGILFPVVEAGATYLSPARYDEVLEIATRLVSMRGARIRFEYEITRVADGVPIAAGHTVHAATGRNGRPRRLPAELRAKLGGGKDGRA
jgi:acyl-CoA thioester hydrolase